MYTNIKTADDLKVAIHDLQAREIVKKQELVENFHALTESLKPMNLIRSTIQNVTSTPGLPGKVINATLGIGAGFLSKKLLIGPSTNILKKIAGNAVKVGVAGFIAKRSDRIKYAGLKLLTNVLGKKKNS